MYGKRATDGRPYEMRGKRGKCVGAVIGRPNGKHMKKKEGSMLCGILAVFMIAVFLMGL